MGQRQRSDTRGAGRRLFAASRGRPPAQPEEDGKARDLLPIVIPEAEEPVRRSRRGWLLGGVALAVLVAGLWWIARPEADATGESAADATGESEADATGESAADATGESAADAAAIRFGGPSRAGFDSALDSVEVSLETYARRQADFDRGRIDCETLATGYARASDHVVALARARARSNELAAERAQAFDAAMTEAAGMDQLFDRSGCPRP